MQDDDNLDREVPCPFCKGVNKDACSHCKGRGTFKLQFASTESVGYLSTYTDMVMEEIYRIAQIEGAWISDLSSVGDFISEDSELAELREALNVPLDFQDTIVAVAKRLRDA